jgi:hypothetical protein
VEVMAGEKLIRASDARKAILKINPKSAYCIDSVPAVDAEEVVHGRWIEDDESARRYCSHCGFNINDDASHELYGDYQVKPKYCPECGAKMDLEVTNNG